MPSGDNSSQYISSDAHDMTEHIYLSLKSCMTHIESTARAALIQLNHMSNARLIMMK
jgi:hypothetical protein